MINEIYNRTVTYGFATIRTKLSSPRITRCFQCEKKSIIILFRSDSIFRVPSSSLKAIPLFTANLWMQMVYLTSSQKVTNLYETFYRYCFVCNESIKWNRIESCKSMRSLLTYLFLNFLYFKIKSYFGIIYQDQGHWGLVLIIEIFI